MAYWITNKAAEAVAGKLAAMEALQDTWMLTAEQEAALRLCALRLALREVTR